MESISCYLPNEEVLLDPSSEVYTFTEANAAIRSLNVDAEREQHTLTFRIPVKPPDHAVAWLTSLYGLPMHETVVSLLSSATISSDYLQRRLHPFVK